MAKNIFFTSWMDNDDDGNLLKALTVTAFLVLLLLFLFGPGYRSAPSIGPIAGGNPAPALSRAPEAVALARPKVLYWVAEPSFPAPVATSTPMPAPTPEGGGILRKIVFTSNRGDGRYFNLYVMNADGKDVVQLTQGTFFDRDPHFSYDGRYLVFSSNRDQGIYQLFLLDLETHAIRQLTSDAWDKTNPFWSPDNQHIEFTFHHDGVTEIGLINADGSDARQLTRTNGDSHGFGFSPNGRLIGFESSWNQRNEIFTYDLAQQQSSLLIKTDDISYRGDPYFSPQGDKLVFTSDVLSRHIRQIYIYDLGWKKYYPLTHDDMDKNDPIFSPDGSKIAYVALWEGAWNIFLMDADGRRVRNLTKSYFDNLVPTWR
jgi:Tol biopolymer transport system component